MLGDKFYVFSGLSWCFKWIYFVGSYLFSEVKYYFLDVA